MEKVYIPLTIAEVSAKAGCVFDYNETTRELIYSYIHDKDDNGIIVLSEKQHKGYKETVNDSSNAKCIMSLNYLRRIFYNSDKAKRPRNYNAIDFMADTMYTTKKENISLRFNPLDEETGDFEVIYSDNIFHFVSYKQDGKYSIEKINTELPLGKSVVLDKGKNWKFYVWKEAFMSGKYDPVKTETKVFEEYPELKKVEKTRENIRVVKSSVYENKDFFEKHYGEEVYKYLSSDEFKPGLFRAFEIMFRTILEKSMYPYINKSYFPKRWEKFHASFGKRLNGFKKYEKEMPYVDDFFNKKEDELSSLLDVYSLWSLFVYYKSEKDKKLNFDFISKRPDFFKKVKRLCERKGHNPEPVYAITNFLLSENSENSVYDFLVEYGEYFKGFDLNSDSTEVEIAEALLEINKVNNFIRKRGGY